MDDRGPRSAAAPAGQREPPEPAAATDGGGSAVDDDDDDSLRWRGAGVGLYLHALCRLHASSKGADETTAATACTTGAC
jgi:hypothetical protein